MKTQTLILLAVQAFAFAFIGCGGDVTETKPAPADCSLDPAGAPFTFTINNTGTRMLRLAYGCGSNFPISLATSHGTLGIGEETAEFCGVNCEIVYKGNSNFGCSDCGPGYGDDLSPGKTATIQWDRRVYQSHTAPTSCGTQDPNQNQCALGLLVKETMVTGTLNVCTDTSMGTSGDGYCGTDFLDPIPITIDLSQSSAVIDVK